MKSIAFRPVGADERHDGDIASGIREILWPFAGSMQDSKYADNLAINQVSGYVWCSIDHELPCAGCAPSPSDLRRYYEPSNLGLDSVINRNGRLPTVFLDVIENLCPIIERSGRPLKSHDRWLTFFHRRGSARCKVRAHLFIGDVWPRIVERFLNFFPEPNIVRSSIRIEREGKRSFMSCPGQQNSHRI